MRGDVEIWEGNTLVHKEANMLVDGAGESIVDMLTVSPSLSGIPSASALLDTSNYTIQAISFGTGSEAFRKNAHRSDGAFRQSIITSAANEFIDDNIGVLGLVFEASSTHPMNSPPGSYYPQVGLPIAPEPMLRTLEENTSIGADLAGIDVSSVFPGNGQLTNFIPSAIFSAVMEDTAFSSTVSGYAAASYLGCFTEGSSVAGQEYYILNDELNDSETVGKTVWSTQNSTTAYQNGSFFNEVSSMDVSGFVNMVMSGSPGTTTDYAMSSGASGLCVSGGVDSINSGTVEYSVMISADDMNFANSYGGIYHLGLWTIDVNQSLLNGNSPPFSFSILDNPRKYKLFSRKGFSKNLCWIQSVPTGAGDYGARRYQDLTIKWRIHFT